MIPVTPSTFSSPSHTPATSEAPHDTLHSHVPLRSHMIHPRALSCTMPHEPVSHPQWVQLQESPPQPSTPDAPDESESSADPWVDAATIEEPSLLQSLLSKLPMSLWSTVLDIDMG